MSRRQVLLCALIAIVALVVVPMGIFRVAEQMREEREEHRRKVWLREWQEAAADLAADARDAAKWRAPDRDLVTHPEYQRFLELRVEGIALRTEVDHLVRTAELHRVTDDPEIRRIIEARRKDLLAVLEEQKTLLEMLERRTGGDL